MTSQIIFVVSESPSMSWCELKDHTKTWGWVTKQSSLTMCETDPPGMRTKHQCLPDDAACVARLPMMDDRNLHTVSWPSDCSMSGKSDCTLAGTPMTHVAIFCSMKYSARSAVHVCTFRPPQITTPSSLSRRAVSTMEGKSSRPSTSMERLWPRRSVPPWFRCGASMSAVSSKAWHSRRPTMPMVMQTTVPSSRPTTKSKRPWTTLFRPGVPSPGIVIPTRGLVPLIRSSRSSAPSPPKPAEAARLSEELPLWSKEFILTLSGKGLSGSRRCKSLGSSGMGSSFTAFRLSVCQRLGKAACTRRGAAQVGPLWSSQEIWKGFRSINGSVGS
mmetsp:Transcript_35270/g.99090  ORF Transcript_35270/g.99090 Transcript_35270/m.99090 type:complete len:330 (-) Transcript_35270:25-1014(-)